MEDTNVRLTLDLGQRVLHQLTKVSPRIAITVDLSPNVMTAIKYIAGSIIIYKSIDVIL
jgi:hypothetical protein